MIDQQTLDAAAGSVLQLPAGRFLVEQSLHVRPNTTIVGAGKRSTVLYSRGAEDFPLLLNAGFGGSGDTGIAISGVGLEGDPECDSASEGLVALRNLTGLTLRDCGFYGRALDCIQLSGCDDIVIDACEFADWGKRIPNPTPGAGQWVSGTAIFCWEPCFNGRITNCYLHDGRGIGIWLPCTNTAQPQPREGECWTVSGNVICRVQEAGIAGTADGSAITGNVIRVVNRTDVSGHGLELHGTRFSLTGNVVSGCAATCAAISNSELATVTGNVFDGDVVVFSIGPEAGQGTEPPRLMTLAGNRIAGKLTFSYLGGQKQHDIRADHVAAEYYPKRVDVAGERFRVTT